MDINQIRSKLFEEVNAKMEGRLDISQDAFMAVEESEIGVIDTSKMYGLRNTEFLEAIYYGMLFRVPDSCKWKMLADKMNDEVYRTELLNAIIVSPECKMKGMDIDFNPYGYQSSTKKYVSKISFRQKMKVTIIAVLKNMPFGLYEKVKKIVGR